MSEIEIPQPEEVQEKAENPFTRTVALFVAFYAVGLAFASFGGHSAAKEMMMAKQNESDAWCMFQSKSTREALYRNEIWRLEAEEKIASLPPDKVALLAKYRQEEQRMSTEKKGLASAGFKDDDGTEVTGAKHYKDEVRLMQKKDTYFDMAEVGFQLSIVMASVSMLSRKRWAFVGSMGLAAIALGLTICGFTLASAPEAITAAVGHG